MNNEVIGWLIALILLVGWVVCTITHKEGRVSGHMVNLAWPYTVRLWRGRALVLETRHATAASRDVEIAAAKARMARGELSSIDMLDHERATTETIIYTVPGGHAPC